MEEDLILYAGWIPVEDTEYTIRHVEDESGSLFYEERGTGTRGDQIIVQPLDPLDPAYPADGEPEPDQQQMVRLVREKMWERFEITTRPVDKRENYIKRASECPGIFWS